MSILTTCAACAKPLDHDAPAHCVNCQTRTYEDIERIARRVLGDAHPLTEWIEDGLQDAQDVLYARGLP